jgi:hypothetical protein
MVEKSNSVWPAALLISALLIVGFLATGFTINTAIKDNAKTSNVDLKPLTDAISVTNGKIDSLITSLTPTAGEVTGVVATESDAEEEKALALATAYLSEDDFLDALVDALDVEISGLDKDDVTVEVLDADVTKGLIKDVYRVTFKLKVLEDGDKIAKVSDVLLKVENVDYDDEFEDAEVVEPTEESLGLNIDRVY